MGNFVSPSPSWRKKAESSETVIEVLHVSVKLVHRPDVQLELVHGGDEERHDLGNQLARVPPVVLDRDWSVLAYPFYRVAHARVRKFYATSRKIFFPFCF